MLNVEQEIVSKQFLERLEPDMQKTFIKRGIFDDSEEIEITLTFYRFFSPFLNKASGHCFHSFTHR